MARSRRIIIAGVDTHTATHHAAVIDLRGRLLADAEFPASPRGYALLAWMRRREHWTRSASKGPAPAEPGSLDTWHEHGVTVLEVPRPDRRLRRQHGKSDPLDAEAAPPYGVGRQRQRSTQTCNRSDRGDPDATSGQNRCRESETCREQDPARSGRNRPRTTTQQLRELSTSQLVDACLRFRPDTNNLNDPVQAAKTALRSIAARARALDLEARALKKQLDALTIHAALATSAIFGLDPDTVSTLLVAIGDNPDRLPLNQPSPARTS